MEPLDGVTSLGFAPWLHSLVWMLASFVMAVLIYRAGDD